MEEEKKIPTSATSSETPPTHSEVLESSSGRPSWTTWVSFRAVLNLGADRFFSSADDVIEKLWGEQGGGVNTRSTPDDSGYSHHRRCGGGSGRWSKERSIVSIRSGRFSLTHRRQCWTFDQVFFNLSNKLAAADI